jgi:hypothetical protein
VKIVKDKISIEDLKQMAKAKFGNLVKAVVDIELGIMAVDAELHADEEALLIANGSKQQDLWGINIYPELKVDEQIEFDSMINLRPGQGNRSRGVEDQKIRGRVITVVKKLLGQ